MRFTKAVIAVVLASCMLLGCGAEEGVSREENSAVETAPENTVEVSEPGSSADSSAEESAEEAAEESVEEESMKVYLPDAEHVKQIGRTEFWEDTLWMAFSGSGAEFQFTGKKAVITFQGDSASLRVGNVDNHARIAIYVNGERVVDDMIDRAEKSYTIVESDTAEECTIQILKLSETAMSTVGIKRIEADADAVIQPAPERDYLIEFIGDSITCGYGVDDEDRNHHFSTRTEDVTKTYAYKTAEAFHADYSMVSISGYGVISGYTADGNEKVTAQTLPQYYEKLGFSYGQYLGQVPQDYSWDFSGREPDLIVVNLGTNDDSYTLTDGERQEEFQTAYAAFIGQIRSCNPNAEIVCTLGIMGDRLYPYVERAVEAYTAETGDERVAAMKFDVQSASDGYAADWHPTEATHQKAAEKLTAYIEELLK